MEMDGASDGKGTSSKRPAEDDPAQPENELHKKFKHIKWKSSDLPTTQDQRAATEKLVYGFKKIGGFDSARKRTFTRFDEGEHKEAFIKAMHDLAEQELEKKPSLLAKDRRQAAPLIEGKAERANLYATAEEVVEQYIDDMFGDEAEEQLREIRRNQVGEAQAADEKERGARAQEYYEAQSAERRAEWARQWEAKQEKQRQLDLEARRKRDQEIEAKIQEELLEKQRKAKKEKEMEEYKALKARQDAEWAWEQKMLDQREEAKRKKEELKAIEEAALRELIEEGKRAAAKSARGDITGTTTPSTRKGKESALAAIMRAEKLEKEAGPAAAKPASEAGQEESPAPAPVTVEPQRKQPILKFGHAGGATTRPPQEPSYDRGSTQDQYYQDQGYGYKHSHHSRSDYQQDYRREDKYYDDKDYSDKRYESKDYKSSSRTDRDDDHYREKDYRDKYDKYDDRGKEYYDKYGKHDAREKDYRDKYDRYNDRYERDDKYKYDTREDDRRGTDRHDEKDKYHDRGRRSSVAGSRHSNEERSSRRSEHGRRDYEKDEEYYAAKDKERTSKDRDYSHGPSRRATLSKHDSIDMPPPPPKESRRTKEGSARARSEEGEYAEPTTHGGSRDRREEGTSRSTRSPSRRDTAYEGRSRREDSPRRYRKRSRSRERDGIDRYVPSSSSPRRDDRDSRDKDRERDRTSHRDGYTTSIRSSDKDPYYTKSYDYYEEKRKEAESYSRGGERDHRDYHESRRKDDRRGDFDEEKSKGYHSKKYEEDYYKDDDRHIYYENREHLDDSRGKFDARARRGDPEAETEFFLPEKEKERTTHLDGMYDDKGKDAQQDAKAKQRGKCPC